ncbi:beta family protein [Corallococcus exercitus]|uniref:beta family protein n=1 Tax=Corallococcus exercitus TaxID=2316736 RepID=UPI0013152717|nr:beta family protein [Corallococcus exercitus]
MKGKRGEYSALKELYPNDLAGLTPVIEVPPVDWNWDDDVAKKTEFAHLTSTVDNLVKYWGTDRPLFVDVETADLSDAVEGDPAGRSPITCLFDLARSKGLKLIPVLVSTADPASIAAVAGASAKDQRGAMLRIVKDHFFSPNLPALLTSRAGQLSLTPSMLDLLIDLEDVDSGAVQAYVASVPILLAALPHLPTWRTLTLASCAFPETLGAFTVGAIGRTPRVDWLLWRQVCSRLAPGTRKPTFADYGISFTTLAEIDPRVLKTPQNIRYTADAEWLIFKGVNFKKNGGAGFIGLCQQLIAQPEFMGAGFSEGDRYIAGCATGTEKPGNPETWRRVGTNHHLTFVVRQIAIASATSAPAAPGSSTGHGGATP